MKAIQRRIDQRKQERFDEIEKVVEKYAKFKEGQLLNNHGKFFKITDVYVPVTENNINEIRYELVGVSTTGKELTYVSKVLTEKEVVKDTKPVEKVSRDAGIPSKIRLKEVKQLRNDDKYDRRYLFKDDKGRLFTGRCQTHFNMDNQLYEIRRISGNMYTYRRGSFAVYSKWNNEYSKYRHDSWLTDLMRVTKEDQELKEELLVDLL